MLQDHNTSILLNCLKDGFDNYDYELEESVTRYEID